MKTWTALRICQSKGQQKLACLTAYDCITAQMLDAAGVPLILVGDSLGMTRLGYATTLPVTVDQIIHHSAAVARGARTALVVADMPFLSYQTSISDGILNAGRMLKEGGAGAVKIEGGAFRSELARALVANGIPVMGHIGLTPQSIHQLGGYKVQGRETSDADRLCADAQALVEAGVFSVVLECIPAALAARITAEISVPTIGIGAGPHCDGQVLVVDDMLGLNDQFQPSFVKRYAEAGALMRRAFAAYVQDVQNGTFPGSEHGYDARK